MAYIWLAAVYDKSPNVAKRIIAFRESRDARPPFEPVTAPSSAPVLARHITATATAKTQGPNTAASAALSRPTNIDKIYANRITPQTRFPSGAGQQTLT